MNWSICRTSTELFCADEAGQDMVEYGLVAALIGLGSIVAMKNLSTSIGTTLKAVGTTLTTSV